MSEIRKAECCGNCVHWDSQIPYESLYDEKYNGIYNDIDFYDKYGKCKPTEVITDQTDVCDKYEWNGNAQG